jgi:hypothetical protein
VTIVSLALLQENSENVNFIGKEWEKKNILEIIGFTEIMPGYVFFVHHGPF